MSNVIDSDWYKFQSTLPHGSDFDAQYAPGLAPISIHAPSRERHDEHIRWSPITGISIHAPSRERRIDRLSFICSSGISIHAPSRERLDT